MIIYVLLQKAFWDQEFISTFSHLLAAAGDASQDVGSCAADGLAVHFCKWNQKLAAHL